MLYWALSGIGPWIRGYGSEPEFQCGEEAGMAIARFSRVSEEQLRADLTGWEDPMAREGRLRPQRPRPPAARDFGLRPRTAARPELAPGQSAVIPTGMRAEMEAGWVLMLFPRSGLGFRHGIRLRNTVGIIDSDYARAENEGHILVKLENPSDHAVVIERGERFCQGVFLPCGLAEEEEVLPDRRGGMGSTGK